MKHKLISVLSVIILVLALSCIIGCSKAENEYDTCISQAEKYLEELDYEQAEAMYLDAILIDSKRLEAYVGLANIYIAQERYEDASEILKKAKEAEAEGDEELEKEKEELDYILSDENSTYTYKWIIEPSIEADDIHYTKDYSDLDDESNNESMKQHYSPYAILLLNQNILIFSFLVILTIYRQVITKLQKASKMELHLQQNLRRMQMQELTIILMA